VNRAAFEKRMSALSETTGVPAGALLQAPLLVIAALEQAIGERDRAMRIAHPLVEVTVGSEVIMWGGKPMREGRCPPGDTCLACDRLGKHLEPIPVKLDDVFAP
jgi:hypothetical protein